MSTDPPSPASSKYVSAPQSPDGTALSQDSEMGLTADEREDRKAWNADLLAGYSLEERVRREGLRRAARDTRRNKEEEEEGENGGEESFEDAEDGAEAAVVPVSKADEIIDEEQKPEQSSPRSDAANAIKMPSPVVEYHTSSMANPTSEGRSPNDSVMPMPASESHSASPDGENVSTGLQAKSTKENTGPTGPEPGEGADKPNEEDVQPVGTPHTPSRDIATVKVQPGSPTSPSLHIGTSPSRAAQAEEAKVTPAVLDTRTSSSVMTDIIEQLQQEDIPPRPSPAHIGSQPSNPDITIISATPPQRKLTRGHAVRHSMSTMIHSPYSRSDSFRSKRESKLAPLFSTTAYSSKPFASNPSNVDDRGQATLEPVEVGFMHRQSAPTLEGAISSPVIKSHASQGGALAHSEGNDPFDRPTRLDVKTLPPHREAALKRRELALRRMDEPQNLQAPLQSAKLSHTRAKSGPLPSSGPLIDFNDFSFAPTEPLAPSLVFPGLHRSALSQDLLGLFGEEGGIAESSKQGAEKAAIVQGLPTAEDSNSDNRDPRAPRHGQNSPTSSPPSPVRDVWNDSAKRKGKSPSIRSVASTASKRRMPPPPPPLRTKTPSIAGDSIYENVISPTKSVLGTATSPITPRPNPTTSALNDTSPTPKPRQQSIPTRRPPPPPPKSSSDTHSIHSIRGIDPPALPPRPPPPAFESRPAHLRHQSALSNQTSSSIAFSEKDFIEKPPLSPWRPKRLSITAKPRGPRPPPPPPRPWAKVVSGEYGQSSSTGVRSMSDNSILSPHKEEGGRTSSAASNPAIAVRDGVSRERSLEYTDLDVIMARLEGTGREYEVGSVITSN